MFNIPNIQPEAGTHQVFQKPMHPTWERLNGDFVFNGYTQLFSIVMFDGYV